MKKWIARLGKHLWPVVWAIQIVESLIVGAAASLALGVHPWAYNAALWVLVPLAGGFTAFRAVRQGLLNYAAWIAPPACLCAAHTLIWGYLPPAGAMLLSAFISLVGAAAGEVFTQQYGKKNRRLRHGKGSDTHL